MRSYVYLPLFVIAVLSLGMVLIHCGDNENGPGCETNEDCPEGFWCNRTIGECECIKQCTGKCCGDDNCGGTCPDQCQTGFTCNPTTCTCESDPGECATDQDCINLYGANYTCNLTTKQCQCNPDCTGKCCGDNGCGGTCQDNCAAPSTCNTTTCVCEWPPCTDDGDCAADQCCIGQTCTPMDCTNLECGNDLVCNKSCGTCTPPATCQNGQCVGDNGLGKACTFGDINAAAGDCDTGLECLGIAADGTAGTCPGGSATECTQLIEEWNRDCVGNNCGASFCSQECDINGDCPAGFVGQDVGDPPVCWCVPEPIGAGDPGDPCPWDTVNASYDECKPGMACLGNDDIGSCPGGTDAECTAVADSWNPNCVSGVCGFSFCSEECDAGTCPAGFYPGDVSGTCYCIPDENGTSQLGDPCPFGDMNNSYDFCASGLTCLGNDDTGTTCSVATDCGIPDVQNPDCQNGVCGFSHCSSLCDANGNCPNGYVPADVGGTCYCVPGEVGTSQAGDPCPFGDVNTTADACAANLACLGFPADGTAGTCTVANDCTTNTEPIPANQNPDCVGGNCGASFCAAECDANGNCEAGFAPIDVSGTCYCAPA